MRNHIDAHLAGSLQGDVPVAWMDLHSRTRCLVCGLSVSRAHGVHPTCRPAARAAAVDGADPMDTDALPLPSLTAIQAAKTATLRHVPGVARHSWNQVFTRALSAVVHSNDDKAWRELLMLPKCVLCAPTRGGRRHSKAAGAYTLDRLHRWQEGDRLGLWESRPTRRSASGQRPSAEQRRVLATSLAREGFDRKACAALVSNGLCAPTTETLEALWALHPQQPPPMVPELNDLPLAPEVARCLRAFPADTAPGPSGLRVQHLKDACIAGSQEAFFSHLAAVVTLLAQGRAPDFVAPVLAGAGLVALPKPKGGVRPIAVGEILRRLTGKCLMTTVRDEARSYFYPAQLGVAVPGGVEQAIHTARAWYDWHQCSNQKVALKLDFSNAFNTVRREVVLSTLSTNFPSLSRWATWCYRQPTRLQFDEWVVESSCGVQQGDPLGPLLFAAALQPIANDLRGVGLDIAVHYLDDGFLAGDVSAVSRALHLVQTEAAAIGLELNLTKSELVAVGRVDAGALHCHFPDALLRDTATGSSRVCRNFEFLGAAIGDDAFTRAHTADRAAKAGDLLDALGELEDPQVALRLLRSCAGFARLLHSMRCNPPSPQTMALDMFDGMIRRC